MPAPDSTPAETAASDLDLAAARAAFVPFDGTLYLDCASQGPRLRAAIAAGGAALLGEAHGQPTSFEAMATRADALRACAATLLFDGDADGVALVPSVAYGAATAARNLPLDAGDTVLVLDGQFPSNLLPWRQRCDERGARLHVVARAEDGDWTTAVLAALAGVPRVRIVALPQVRWDDGRVLDLDRIAESVHALGAALVLDLSQSLGVLPAQIARWRPDFVLAVGYKWLLGAIGLAWLWAAPRWRVDGVSIAPHWSGHDPGPAWRFPAHADIPQQRGARRFDTGGVAEPVRLAIAHAALEQLARWGLDRIAQTLAARTHAFDAALDAHDLTQWKTPGHAPHLCALRPPAERLDALWAALQRERIACTCRYGLLRIAPHLHVDDEDMRRVAEVVARAA